MITRSFSADSEVVFFPGKDIKVGKILLEERLITENVLEDALEYQKKYGGNTTQYLLKYGYVSEEDLARAISSQTGFPYLPLKAYEIPESVIGLIPAYIAEKYWLIPVDRMGSIITVVMANPCDKRVIKELEDITQCSVRPFVGVTSEIAAAIERYYKIDLKGKKLEAERRIAPLFVREKTYAGLERRKALRIRAEIPICFSETGRYTDARTEDVSRCGVLFESPYAIPTGSFLNIKMDIPEMGHLCVIYMAAQVARVTHLSDKKFGIGVRIVNIQKDAADKFISYAIRHSRSAGGSSN